MNQNQNANENANANQTNETNTAADYIEAINQLKQNSVSRNEYDALVAEKKQLLQSIVNGVQQTQEETQAAPDYEAIKKEARENLFGGKKELSNLEYCQNALNLREAVLETEGIDIFVGQGHNITPEQSDYEKAERVAAVMAECIEKAQGNSSIFTAELMARTKDVSLPGARANNRPVRR